MEKLPILPIEVDWTIDPKTNRSNSSPEFVQLVSEVTRLIKNDLLTINGSLKRGENVEGTARLIIAQLAHVHGLAPQKIAVKSVNSSPKGILRGLFEWNDVIYKFEAKPASK